MSYCSVHGSMTADDCVECNPYTDLAPEPDSEGVTSAEPDSEGVTSAEPDSEGVTSASLTEGLETLITCPGCSFGARTPQTLGAHVKSTHEGMKLHREKSDDGTVTYSLAAANE